MSAGAAASTPSCGQKLVIVELVGGADRSRLRARQKPLMIEGFKQGAAIVQLAQAIEAHGIQPLEDVAVFPVLRGAAVLFDEPLNLLEAGDDALLARRPARSFFVSASTPSSSRRASSSIGELSHARPPSFMRQGRPHLRPSAFPRHPASDRGQPAALLLELHGAHGKFPRFLDRQA